MPALPGRRFPPCIFGYCYFVTRRRIRSAAPMLTRPIIVVGSGTGLGRRFCVANPPPCTLASSNSGGSALVNSTILLHPVFGPVSSGITGLKSHVADVDGGLLIGMKADADGLCPTLELRNPMSC